MFIANAIHFTGKAYGTVATCMAIYDFIDKNNEKIYDFVKKTNEKMYGFIGKTMHRTKEQLCDAKYFKNFKKCQMFLTKNMHLSMDKDGTNLQIGFYGFRSKLTPEIFRECLHIVHGIHSCDDVRTNVDIVLEAMTKDEGLDSANCQMYYANQANYSDSTGDGYAPVVRRSFK